ncbi:hypothetical protein GYMLUDRAFT_251604 [Collybiopsis luxurians FD-317 M1]|uniref:Uncharacterized protein n=1 Tax=Collybiopsis luxurians FD-317 M1 TaxID=944289 RepID=A0A0D0CAP2_9AGAR|nr:hypothetical protein GYMLUDRAFT_251604 [Collybiopsis luxurians FD-317 M1]
MGGCRFHSEDTGLQCDCTGFEDNSEDSKCILCDHSEKVHYGSTESSSTLSPKKLLKTHELLKSLAKTRRFTEANQEANKNLTSSQKTSSAGPSRSRKSTGGSQKDLDGGSSSKFSVGKVLVFPLRLQFNEDDFLSLETKVKYNENIPIYLQNLNMGVIAKSRDDLVFDQKWTTEQVEKKLQRVLGSPVSKHIVGDDGLVQWRVLRVAGSAMKLVAEDSPTGQTLYTARGPAGKAWSSYVIAIIPILAFSVDSMKAISGDDWDPELTLFPEFDRVFPKAKGKKRARSPSPITVESDDEDTANVASNDDPPQRTSNFQIPWHDGGIVSISADKAGESPTPDSDADGDYQPPRLSSPIPEHSPMNVWDLGYTLQYI